MKFAIPLFFSVLASAIGQVPPAGVPGQSSAPTPPAHAHPPVAPDTVVATIEGKKLTAADVDKLVEGLPPQLQQNVRRDRRQFLQQWALFKRISQMAEKNQLDQKSPYKERLEYMRMQLLLNAQLDQVSQEMPVPAEDQQKFYEANRDRFTQAKIKVIYIPFSPAAGQQPTDPKAKKPMTEAEAKTKAESIAKEIRAGADFVKMVKEHSEDPQSADKDGDFGQPISRSDSIPDDIKNAVFALKPGQLSDPVRQPNGYYIFRLEELSVQPYDQVQSKIFQELKEAGFRKWFEAQQKQVDVKFENESYFAPQDPAPPTAPRP